MRAKLPEIAAQPLHVHVVPAGDGNLVRHAARHERAEREGAHLDGVVDQLVVVRRGIGSESVAWRALAGHCRGDAPSTVARAARPQDLDLAGARLRAEHAEEHAWPVEEAVRGVQVRAAHRQVPRVDFGRDGQRAAAGRRAPGVLVDLGDAHRPAAARGTDRHHVAGKIADEIAAGNPRRHREALPRGVWIRDRDAHLEPMRLRRLGMDAVAYRIARHGEALLSGSRG